MQTLETIDLLELIGRDTSLTYAAGTSGGEWAGPCPFCNNGKDRLRVQPYTERGGRWWCRQCAEDKHWYHAIDYVRKRNGLSYREACTALNIEPPRRQPPRPLAPPVHVEPPGRQWQVAAAEVVQAAQLELWSSTRATYAINWLKQRGFGSSTIWHAELGFNAKEHFVRPEEWGLPIDHKKIWLPAGIVIPWRINDSIWKLYIRRLLTDEQKAEGEKPYIQVAGCSNALYNADGLDGKKPVVLTEGVFDALAIKQQAGDLVAAVATGTTGSRRARWITAIARAPCVFLSYDADVAGEKAARAWGDILQPHCFRWRPFWDDPAAMLQGGADVRAWIIQGMDYMTRYQQERSFP